MGASLLRLHEDQADLGGSFEDQFTVAGGAGGIVQGDELVGEAPDERPGGIPGDQKHGHVGADDSQHQGDSARTNAR